MKNKKIMKQFLTILVMAVIILLTNVGDVKASLQSNPNTQYTKVDGPESWVKNFREMEKPGEAMGLSESLNEDLTSSSGSNNIDVHMMKSTEYGAIAILSASGYGNPSNEQEITSTTGNATGMMLNTNYWEIVAGGLENNIFAGVNAKYYDTYTGEQTSARVGDALGNATTSNPGCSGWHKASGDFWVGMHPYFNRGLGGIFSKSWSGSAYTDQRVQHSRGVVVCGMGL